MKDSIPAQNFERSHAHIPAMHQAMHHMAIHEGGTGRGSHEGGDKHSLSSVGSDSLIHHLKPSDWHEHSARRDRAAAGDHDGRHDGRNDGRHDGRNDGRQDVVTDKGHKLPDLKIDGHEHLKQALVDDKISEKERMSAARRLVQDGVHSVHVTDAHGKAHDYRLKLFHNGKVTITEDNAPQNVAAKTAAEKHVVAPARVADHHTPNPAPPQYGRASGMNGGRIVNNFGPAPHEANRYGAPHNGNRHGVFGFPSGDSRPAYQQPVSERRQNAGSYDGDGRMRGGSSVRNMDGSVSFHFTGLNVDTDGHGASRHGEDPHRRPTTALVRSDGQYLDTDRDSFVVLSPSMAAKYGIKVGDLGRLIRKDTGQSVEVVFGDTGHEGRTSAEASIAAIRRLGFRGIDGNNGITGGQFEIVLAPRSGNGRGDIARSPELIASRLDGGNQMASNR